MSGLAGQTFFYIEVIDPYWQREDTFFLAGLMGFTSENIKIKVGMIENNVDQTMGAVVTNI